MSIMYSTGCATTPVNHWVLNSRPVCVCIFVHWGYLTSVTWQQAQLCQSFPLTKHTQAGLITLGKQISH